MAQAALTVVGYVVGSFFGAPQLGAVIGGLVGGYIAAPDVEGPRLQTGAPKNLDYGWPIRRIYGRRRIVDPYKAWQSPRIEDAHEQDAKGGPTQTTYSYRSHVRFIVGKAGPVAVTRIWINKVLRWTSLASASAETLQASAQTDAFTSITFMDGNPAQLPWSIEELYEGTDNVTAARGLCCVCIESLQHGFSENPPLVEIEVVELATTSTIGDGLLCHFDELDEDGSVISALGPNVVVGAGGSLTGTDTLFGTPQSGVVAAGGSNSTFFSAGGMTGSTERSWRMEGFIKPVNAQTPIFNLFGEGGHQIAIGGAGTMYALSVNQTSAWGSGGGLVGIGANAPQVGVWNHVGIEYVPADSAIYLFCNGVRVGMLTGTGAPFPGSDWVSVYIGGEGQVDEWYLQYDVTTPYGTSYVVPDGPFEASSIMAVTPLPSDLADIVAAELEEGGLTSAQYDVSALVGIPVDGWDTVRSPRQGIEELMLVHNFDWVCGETLDAVLLGGASSATFAYADLGAGVDEADPECFNPERGNDQEVPYKRELAYVNIADDHAVGVVEQSRHVAASAELRRDSVNVAMTPERAQGVVDTIVARARVEASPATVKVTEKHVRNECTDVVTVVDEDGTLHRRRITQDTYSRGIHTFETVGDDAQAYRTAGITFDQYTESIVVRMPGTVELVLIDGPLLRDADDLPGGYAAFDLDANARSARLLSSADGTNYTHRLVCTDDAAIGTTADALPAPANPYRWDETSRFTATLSGTVSSSTRAAMQADRTLNTLIVGAHGRWEVVRFRTATLIDSTDTTFTYNFSGLIRADYGTEHAMDVHEAGDRVVVLRVGFGIRSVEQGISEIGLERYWKAPADGRPSSTADEQLLAFDGERLEPRSPTRPRCARDTAGNAVLSFSRRTRYATRAGGPGGSVFPLGETVEAYEVDVYADDSFTTVVRTLTDWTLDADGCPVFPYSAADQTADGLTPGDPLSWRAYQRSALVGRGHELEATA